MHADYQQLATWIAAHDPAPADWMRPHDRHTPPAWWIARRLDVTKTTVYRWRRTNRIPLHHADRFAIRLGTHPLLIWPDLHNNAA
jgi:hypothetical protein